MHGSVRVRTASHAQVERVSICAEYFTLAPQHSPTLRSTYLPSDRSGHLPLGGLPLRTCAPEHKPYRNIFTGHMFEGATVLGTKCPDLYGSSRSLSGETITCVLISIHTVDTAGIVMQLHALASKPLSCGALRQTE